MSVLGKPFEHDLFVSYSHGAFKGEHDSDLKLWSQKFAKDMRAELARAIEFENVSVFLDDSDRDDEGLDRVAGLTEQLRRRVQNSALLTVIMSSHYLRSNWCRDERDWWCEKHHPDTLGTRGRIFVCRVWPTEEADWPVELCDERRIPLPGYHCYDRNKHPDTARPFAWRGYARDRDDYIDLLVELSGDVMQRLRAIRAALEQRRKGDEAAARLAAESGQVIYLHAREAHAEAWQRAGDALVDRGFVVLPAEPDPISRDPLVLREIAERRVEILSGCDGLLLLGTKDGRALDADLVVVGRQDRQSARARTDRLLPCGVLDTAGLATATPRRKTLARSLGIHWIDTTDAIWPTEVKSWLNEASAVIARA
jgi:hypothetical protein